ncbi:MAG: hypothetical protein BWX64_01550 [Acidobacteria bacterium ADurb.Bin051]|nr:MAG: hypothetical protein BWX64_01550 [Acidobacteria bacterium ADurb.Bin051]
MFRHVDREPARSGWEHLGRFRVQVRDLFAGGQDAQSERGRQDVRHRVRLDGEIRRDSRGGVREGPLARGRGGRSGCERGVRSDRRDRPGARLQMEDRLPLPGSHSPRGRRPFCEGPLEELGCGTDGESADEDVAALPGDPRPVRRQEPARDDRESLEGDDRSAYRPLAGADPMGGALLPAGELRCRRAGLQARDRPKPPAGPGGAHAGRRVVRCRQAGVRKAEQPDPVAGQRLLLQMVRGVTRGRQRCSRLHLGRHAARGRTVQGVLRAASEGEHRHSGGADLPGLVPPHGSRRHRLPDLPCDRLRDGLQTDPIPAPGQGGE